MQHVLCYILALWATKAQDNQNLLQQHTSTMTSTYQKEQTSCGPVASWSSRAKWHKMKAKSWKKPGNCLRVQPAYCGISIDYALWVCNQGAHGAGTYPRKNTTKIPPKSNVGKTGPVDSVAFGTWSSKSCGCWDSLVPALPIYPFMLVGTVPFH